MLTHDEVVWGYRYILGRDPENGEVISTHAATHSDVPAFRAALLRCPEFERILIPSMPPWFETPYWVAAPVLDGSRLMWIDLSDRYVSVGCLQDHYEIIESRFIKRVLRPGDIFVDIGANVGWYTMLASAVVGDSGHIHAFEPRRPTVDYLQRTVELNRLQHMVTVHPIGLADEAKSETLMWSKSSYNGGGATLARNDASTDMVCQAIEVRQLDTLDLKHVDVIKIDVEGAELLTMNGAKKTIDRDRPIILTEVLPSQLRRVSGCTSQEYLDFFLSRDYRGYIVDRVRCGELVQSFPSQWRKGLVNLGFVPAEREFDPGVFAT